MPAGGPPVAQSAVEQILIFATVTHSSSFQSAGNRKPPAHAVVGPTLTTVPGVPPALPIEVPLWGACSLRQVAIEVDCITSMSAIVGFKVGFHHITKLKSKHSSVVEGTT